MERANNVMSNQGKTDQDAELATVLTDAELSEVGGGGGDVFVGTTH
ncbi:hypothetical protein DSM104443_02076 [Usitatibacter rugosus]|uniref:Uncharacterized protein n=1 Tax=Usitatibacter rugosus TaxID=2732067 RepID=A0A6M4GVG3_9PROT|nr:hypothetical protein DSM104443_02076 [Usitatibacter rugosus]